MRYLVLRVLAAVPLSGCDVTKTSPYLGESKGDER